MRGVIAHRGGFLSPLQLSGRLGEPHSPAGGNTGPCGLAFCCPPTPPHPTEKAKPERNEEGGRTAEEGGGGRDDRGRTESRAAGVLSPLLLAGDLAAFSYSALDLEMFPFPLIDQLQAAKLSSVLLLARSSFLHFLYKETERRGGGKQADLGQC